MSTLGELLAEHTVLPGGAVDHLHAVVSEWQLLADMSFGDYLLWVQIAAQGKVYASGSEQAAFVRHSQSLSLQQLGTPLHLKESRVMY